MPYFAPFNGSNLGFSEYFSFNILEIKAEEGGSLKKVAGEYWDQNFLLDTIGSYEITARDRFLEELNKLDAKLYLQDEKNIYFSFIDNKQYFWGRFFSKDHKSYRILLIREKSVDKRLNFNSEQEILHDEFLAKMPLPPIVRPIDGSVAVTGKYSKYNKLTIKYSQMGKRYEKTAGGRFWDYKFEIRDKEGKKDTSISILEIKENFINAVIASNGEIFHDFGYLLIFSVPGDGFTVWCRLSILQHASYILNIVQELEADYSDPVEIR